MNFRSGDGITMLDFPFNTKLGILGFERNIGHANGEIEATAINFQLILVDF